MSVLRAWNNDRKLSKFAKDGTVHRFHDVDFNTAAFISAFYGIFLAHCYTICTRLHEIKKKKTPEKFVLTNVYLFLIDRAPYRSLQTVQLHSAGVVHVELNEAYSKPLSKILPLWVKHARDDNFMSVLKKDLNIRITRPVLSQKRITMQLTRYVSIT